MNRLKTFTKVALCLLIVWPVGLSAQTVSTASKAPAAQAPVKKANYTVSGVIKDKDGVTMEYCDVILRSTTDEKFLRGTVSNSEGKFKISIPEGEYKLSISMMGYGAYVKTIKLDKNTDMGTVVLSVDAKMLSEVVVTSRLIEREADKFVMNNVSSSPIAIGKSSLEILNIAPGVFVDNDGKITMNGKSGTRIMINDRFKNMDGEQLAAYLRNIKAEDILKVEIIPNPGAEYESSSAGGIIHYTIKKSALQGYNGSLGVGYRQNDYAGTNASANLEYKGEKLSLYGSMYYYDNKNGSGSTSEAVFKTQGNRRDSKSFNKGDNNNKMITLGMMYEINKNQSFGFEADLSGYENASRSTSNMFMNEGVIKKHVPTKSTNDGDYGYNTISANYRIKTDSLGSMFKVLADWTQRRSDYFSDYDSRYMIYNPLTEEYDILERDNIYKQGRNSDNQNISIAPDYKHMFSKTTVLRVGAKYNRLQVEDQSDYSKKDAAGNYIPDPNRQDEYNYNEDLAAAFATFSFTHKKFSYTLGLRLETYRMAGYSVTLDKEYVHSGTNLFPNVYVSYNIDKKKGNSVGLSYNRRIRRPYYSQLNPNVIQYGDFDITVGRPDIRPSFANSLNLSSTWKYKYNFSLGFTNQSGVYDQVTIPNPDKPNSTISTYAEVKKDNNISINANLPFTPTKWWRINTNFNFGYRSYTVLDVKRESLSGYGNVYSSFTLPKDWTTYVSAFGYNFGGGGNSTSTFNWQASAGITKRCLKNKNLTLSLSINDLFNTSGKYNYRVETPDFYQASRSDRMGRTFAVSARWSFARGKKIQISKVEAGNSEDRGRL